MVFNINFPPKDLEINIFLKFNASQKSEEKRSTTVDVWRGNYDDFTDPRPKITIIKKYKDPKDDIAYVLLYYKLIKLFISPLLPS